MSEYDNIINELRDMHTRQASEYIPKAYQALINEGLDPFSARDRIEKDLIDIFSKRTIRRYLPNEAKHVEKVREQITIASTPSGPAQYIPLKTPDIKPQSQQQPTQKLRLSYDLDIKGQIIPLTVRLYVDWNTKEIDIDRMDIEL